MTFVFRVDSSIDMGSGHVMRCLTLADALKAQGMECHFICRSHPGHLINHIEAEGYPVHQLPLAQEDNKSLEPRNAETLSHAHWLGATQQEDAEACLSLLHDLNPNWLVVDHYALDSRWERKVAHICSKVMVIDDLADRPHICDLLLDQNLGREAIDYSNLVPQQCQILAGPQYALLRPEFAALREFSLRRRNEQKLEQILITMGGVDKDNATGKVLAALKNSVLPAKCRIKIVMGASAPWLAKVRQQADALPWETQVLVNINDMAQQMVVSDLAIGAAGSTSWERCCLGVPTLMVVLAENQRPIARALDTMQAARLVGVVDDIPGQLPETMNDLVENQMLVAMSENARGITDGSGVTRVMDALEQMPHG